MSKHSPGPWTSDPEGEIVAMIQDASGDVVGAVHGVQGDPLREANERLVAAAPDLLEALRECVTEDGATCYRTDDPRDTHRRFNAINAIARAAIEAATA